jgi:hypothetical protein
MAFGPFTTVRSGQKVLPDHVNQFADSRGFGSAYTRDEVDALVGTATGSVNAVLNAKDYGALGDGTGALLSSAYGTLAAAQADFPSATALTETIDWAALQSACDFLATRTLDGWDGGELYVPNGLYKINQQLVIPKQVVVRGEGRGATGIGATATFPTSTPVVVLHEYGVGGEDVAFGCRAENLGIDCNSITGSIGIASGVIQEQSGIYQVGVYNFMAKGIEIDGTYGHAQNFGLYDIEVYAASAATNPTGMHFNLVKPGSVGHLTAVDNGAAAGSGYGVLIEASEIEAHGIGAERWSSGIMVLNGSTVDLTSVRGRFITENLVYLASSGTANKSVNLRMIGVSSSDIGLGYVYDQATNYYETNPVARYTGGTDAGWRIFSGAGTPESNIVGRIGDLYLRTDGSTSTTLYVKTSGTGNTGWTAK